MSSASNDPGPEAGNVSGDEGCAPALGENAALGGIWQLSRGIKFQGSSDQPAQRTWRSDYGIVFSNSKHTQQPITNALAIGSYQRSHFTSSSKVDGPRFDYRPKDAPRSLSLLVHEGNVFGKPPYKDEEEDAGVPKRILPLTPRVGKPTSVPRVFGGQSQGSVKAPKTEQVKKQSKVTTNKPNVKTDRSAKALIGISPTTAQRDGLKAGTPAKKGVILDKTAGQAEDNAAQTTNTKSAQVLIPTSSEAIESTAEHQLVQEVPKAKPSPRKAKSIGKTKRIAQLSLDRPKPCSTGKAISKVQFKHPYRALEKVQSYCGSKPTGWVPAQKNSLSKTSNTTNPSDWITQIRLVSPPEELLNSAQSSSSKATKSEMHIPQGTHQLLTLKSASESILSDAVTKVEPVADVSTSQMALKDDKICHHGQVNSHPPRMQATDKLPFLEDPNPGMDSLEPIDEIDDSQHSSWLKYQQLAEVEDCPLEGFGFPHAEPQTLLPPDDQLFSDTLFSFEDKGFGSAYRKPSDQVSQGYAYLMGGLAEVERMAKSSILRRRLHIMRDEVKVLGAELQVHMYWYRRFRHFRVEFDRYSTLNPESQQLLLYLVNKERVTAPFNDYDGGHRELALRYRDLRKNCISSSGRRWNKIHTVWTRFWKIKDTNTFFNVTEMARAVWEACDEGYGTPSREHFDKANQLTAAITRRVKTIQDKSNGLIDSWRENSLDEDHKKYRLMVRALRWQFSSMQPCLYAYTSITVKRSMEMAANAAMPRLLDEHDNLSGSAEAVIPKVWSSKARRGVQKVSVRKVIKGETRVSFRRLHLQPTQNRNYHTIHAGVYSDEKFRSTPDPNNSPPAEGDDVVAGVASITADESDKASRALSSNHVYLKYQIPESRLREAMLASRSTGAAYWQYSLHENAMGKKPRVHYCKTMEATERISQLFVNEEVLGFDIEWKPGANPSDGIKNNVSLVQLANEERIALFHIARFGKDGIENLVSPTLRQIMEDPNITKVGVSIKADCTRLRKFMAIQSRGLFELSHLYKLVRYSDGNVKKIDKRLVALAQQVEEHLQLPMWKGEVRSSDWTEDLSYQQIQYAASDSYAGLQLYDVMEGKRKALVPTPPRPEHAELNIPIRLANGHTVSTCDEPEEITNENPIKDDESQSIDIEEMARDFLNIAIEDSEATQPPVKLLKAGKLESCLDKPPEIIAAEDWIQQWRATLPSDYKAKATPAYLRAYFLWHHSDKEVLEAASILRDPPLQASTVSNYILEAIRIEKLPFDSYRLPEVLAHLPTGLAKGKYQSLRKLVN